MSLQEKVEDLAAVLGLEHGAIINGTEFYCMPSENNGNFVDIKGLFQKKYSAVRRSIEELERLRAEKKTAESETNETAREERLSRIRARDEDYINSVAATMLTKEEILAAARVAKAHWKEYTLGGLPLRAPALNGRIAGTIDGVVISDSLPIKASKVADYERHAQAFERIETLTHPSNDEQLRHHVRFECYIPSVVRGGKANLEPKKDEKGYKVTGTAGKRFEATGGQFRSINIMYACTIHPASQHSVQGKITELLVAVDIAEKGFGTQRYWTRFHIAEGNACVQLAQKDLNTYVHLKQDKPQWRNGAWELDNAKEYLGAVSSLVNIITSWPIDEIKLVKTVGALRAKYRN